MRVFIIANPASDKGKGYSRLSELTAELDHQQIPYELVVTEKPLHAASLAREAASEGYQIVAAAGGDGTANEVANGIIQATREGFGQPKMALLPIGRGNDFGFCMGVPHDLKKSVAILAAGKTRKIDVGFMTGGLFPNGRYFINGIGIGIDAAINFVATRSKISGFPGYLLATFRTLVDYKPAEMEIQLDSMTIVQPTMLVSAMNGRRLGGGFLVAPAAVMDDGFFDVLIGDGMSKLRTLTVLPRFFNGSQEKDSKVHIYRSRTLKVRAISGILPAHADGETVSNDGDRITAELFPAMLEVITDGNPEAN